MPVLGKHCKSSLAIIQELIVNEMVLLFRKMIFYVKHALILVFICCSARILGEDNNPSSKSVHCDHLLVLCILFVVLGFQERRD